MNHCDLPRAGWSYPTSLHTSGFCCFCFIFPHYWFSPGKNKRTLCVFRQCNEKHRRARAMLLWQSCLVKTQGHYKGGRSGYRRTSNHSHRKKTPQSIKIRSGAKLKIKRGNKGRSRTRPCKRNRKNTLWANITRPRNWTQNTRNCAIVHQQFKQRPDELQLCPVWPRGRSSQNSSKSDPRLTEGGVAGGLTAQKCYYSKTISHTNTFSGNGLQSIALFCVCSSSTAWVSVNSKS